jgi:hypothetical protein
MFHVVDHEDVVCSGDLSQTTRYIIERYRMRLDIAIRSGLRILYTDSLHDLNELDAAKFDIGIAAASDNRRCRPRPTPTKARPRHVHP